MERTLILVFLYEKFIATEFFAAHVRAQRMGITADIMTRTSQLSSGYCEIVQDSLADLVRIMLDRCYDEVHYPHLYQYCRDLRGRVWECAFPNVRLCRATLRVGQLF